MCACRALYSQVHALPDVDYSDESLLEPDPDLVLQALPGVQEGPDALPAAAMQPFLHKWEGLVERWSRAWMVTMDQQVGCRIGQSSAERPARNQKIENTSMPMLPCQP